MYLVFFLLLKLYFVISVDPMLYRATPVSLDSFNFEEYRETATLHAEHVFVLLLFDGKDELYDIMGKVNRHFLQVPLALLFIGSFSVDAEQKHSYNVSERLFYKHKHNSDVWGLIPKQYITFEHLVGLLDYYIKETSLEVEKKINNLKNWDSQKSDSTYVSDVYEVSKLLRETGDYKRAGEYQRKLRDILSHTPSENKLDINLMLYAVGHDYFDPLGAIRIYFLSFLFSIIVAFDGGYYSDDSKEFHKLQLELYFSYLLSWKNSDLKHHFPIIRSLVQPGDVVIECGVRNMIAVFAFLAGNPKKYIGVDLFEPSFKNYFLARRYALELNIDFEFIRGMCIYYLRY